MDLTGSSFEGMPTHGPIQMEGKGKYTFPNGNVYIGDFEDGMFHGIGTLHIVEKGKFVGRWDRGRIVDGKYFFEDGLIAKLDDWKYCSEGDRRFYSERLFGLNPAGQSKHTNSGIIASIPQGCFDTGTSYYDPSTGNLHNYSGVFLRKASQPEADWIVLNCRVQR
ncbi:MAG: putative radial spoke head 1 [Streblomastix strix]|uniref:MORN repeat-containing protein 5 n=1 Tax=Streblomastix strix TaxID=222440 RepID=A0A5J4VHN5_9EUKA|nr:MAG: putative radial spoke head 1 [Streblomastix strix]